MSYDPDKVLNILKKVSSKYRGPGGAVAVLKDGRLVSQHVWGYADLERRIPITPDVLFPICSITKQFASALLFDLTKNPPPSVRGDFQEQMLSALREILPSNFVDDAGLTVDNLVDMCSGIRDYWAICTLQGSRPDTPYLLSEHNEATLRRLKTLHFQPGTQYSYSNTNFNILERLIERVTGTTLSNLLQTRILQPASMKTAGLCPRTDRFPSPIIGYEGTEKTGFYPAPNNIEWSADAGMIASLTDMIAYETYFDKQYQDSSTGYKTQVTPLPFKTEGNPQSWYRHGLRHAHVGDTYTIGHGGALRGYRLFRLYVPDSRLSTVVLFNHMSSAPEAGEFIIKKLLSVPSPPPPNPSLVPDKAWFGNYLDESTQLSVRVTQPETSHPMKRADINVAYTRTVESLRLDIPTHGRNRSMEASLTETGEVHLHRFEDNHTLTLRRLPPLPTEDNIDNNTNLKPIQGHYQCSETESTLTVTGTGTMLYALFNGPFGHGPPHLMTPLGGDVWIFANPRAMDDTPPGDWTCVFGRDGEGKVMKVVVGCWLARRLEFGRVG